MQLRQFAVFVGEQLVQIDGLEHCWQTWLIKTNPLKQDVHDPDPPPALEHTAQFELEQPYWHCVLELIKLYPL